MLLSFDHRAVSQNTARTHARAIREDSLRARHRLARRRALLARIGSGTIAERTAREDAAREIDTETVAAFSDAMADGA